MTAALNFDTLKFLLTEKISIELFDTIDSTNDYLLAQKNSSATVCLAEHQPKGKGQLGRVGHSPHGENIYLAYRCVLKKPMGELGSLSMLLGETVCNILHQFGIKEGLTVKWPNDVLFNGKKLAGILIEVQAAENNGSRVVMGVGLNVNMTTDADSHISQPWTSMQLIKNSAVDRNKVVAELINLLIKETRRFEIACF